MFGLIKLTWVYVIRYETLGNKLMIIGAGAREGEMYLQIGGICLVYCFRRREVNGSKSNRLA